MTLCLRCALPDNKKKSKKTKQATPKKCLSQKFLVLVLTSPHLWGGELPSRHPRALLHQTVAPPLTLPLDFPGQAREAHTQLFAGKSCWLAFIYQHPRLTDLCAALFSDKGLTIHCFPSASSLGAPGHLWAYLCQGPGKRATIGSPVGPIQSGGGGRCIIQQVTSPPHLFVQQGEGDVHIRHIPLHSQCHPKSLGGCVSTLPLGPGTSKFGEEAALLA